jgi:hypothetical protein
MAQAEIMDAISPALLAPEVIATVVAETAVVEANAQKEAMRPDNWNEIVPKGTQINDDYLSLLKTKPQMIDNYGNGSSYNIRTNIIKIDTKRHSASTIGNVLSHEFGHAIHYQNEWVTHSKVNPLIREFFNKHQKMVGVGVRGEERIKLLNDAYQKLKYSQSAEFLKQFNDIDPKLLDAHIINMFDFFGALTKNKIGGGHKNIYYKTINNDKMEYMAHVFENFYNGNPVFKKLFPSIYDDTIELLNQLIKLKK